MVVSGRPRISECVPMTRWPCTKRHRSPGQRHCFSAAMVRTPAARGLARHHGQRDRRVDEQAELAEGQLGEGLRHRGQTYGRGAFVTGHPPARPCRCVAPAPPRLGSRGRPAAYAEAVRPTPRPPAGFSARLPVGRARPRGRQASQGGGFDRMAQLFEGTPRDRAGGGGRKQGHGIER